MKIHTRFDLNKGIPDAFVVTDAIEHDKTAMDSLSDSKPIFQKVNGNINY